MRRLFASLKAEFGPRWAAQFVSEEAALEVRAAWWVQVHDLTPAEIVRGLDAMQVGQDAWPPGPRAFRKLCRPVAEPQRTGAHVLYLPSPPRSQEARQAAIGHLEALRATLPAQAPQGAAGALVEPSESLTARRAEFVRRRAADLAAAGIAVHDWSGGAA